MSQPPPHAPHVPHAAGEDQRASSPPVAPKAAPGAAQSRPEEPVAWYPHARGGRIGGPDAATAPVNPLAGLNLARFLPASRAGMLAVVIASVMAIEGALFTMRASHSSVSASRGGQSRAGEATAGATSPDGRLFEALQAGAVSPRGISARESNPDRLLELASQSLQGNGATRDSEEGAFWLKRYLATALGDERTLRALTRLGSVYAEPQGAGQPPDFGKSRQLWEMAAALGDPVAMCFLGSLNEHGLGGAQDRGAALQWFSRAKVAGGCPAVDEAIARLK